MKPKIMYIERKVDGLKGIGRIGWVRFSKTGKTLYYDDLTLISTSAAPLKSNYFDENTLEDYWISGAKKDGKDSLFASVVEIDEDAREHYWVEIRKLPNQILETSYKSPGKTKAERMKLEKGLRRRQMDNGWMPS